MFAGGAGYLLQVKVSSNDLRVHVVSRKLIHKFTKVTLPINYVGIGSISEFQKRLLVHRHNLVVVIARNVRSSSKFVCKTWFHILNAHTITAQSICYV